MKRILILLFVILAAGAFIGEKLVQDPGYVLLSYNNTTLETSVWVLLLLSFFAFLVVHWTLNLFFKLGLPGKSFGQWRTKRIANSAQKRTFKGLIALSEGNWWQAQRLLSQAAPTAAQPLINYLGAAKAAHELGNEENADSYFAKARQAAPEAEVSIALQEVEVASDLGDDPRAFTILKRLHSLAPKHSGILRDLVEFHERQADWIGLIALLPTLRKSKIFSTDKLHAVEANCYQQMLKTVAGQFLVESTEDMRIKALNKSWKTLPKSLNQSSSMMLIFAQVLVDADVLDEAEKFLTIQIKRSWDNDLIALYGTIKTTQSARQYKQVLQWINKQPTLAALQLCAARIAIYIEKWPEAVVHYENSIDLQPSIEAYRGLSKLLESLGEHEKALEIDHLAMQLSEDTSRVNPLTASLKTPQNPAVEATLAITLDKNAPLS